MSKKKKTLYSNCIDFDAELNDYKKLCRERKNSKYGCYSAWKNHICKILANFKDKTELIDFERFCKNRERRVRVANVWAQSILAAVCAVVIERFMSQISNSVIISSFDTPNNLIAAIIVVLCYLTLIAIAFGEYSVNMLSNSYNKNLYNDIIEIIQLRLDELDKERVE
ncbi:MAG: hypothetical protein LUG88_04795 [Clostridia bacterium]|nr:hypothetical protein [Clostridia bacterium]